MTEKTRIEWAQNLVHKQHELQESKRALDEKIKAKTLELEREIEDGGNVEKAKKALLAERKLVEQRKTLNSKKKNLTATLEALILGDGRFSDQQITIDEFIEKSQTGELQEEKK